MSDDDSKEHHVGFTIAELTVIACAIDAHQRTVDRVVGYRGSTRFHDSVMSKIKTYCDQLAADKARSMLSAAYVAGAAGEAPAIMELPRAAYVAGATSTVKYPIACRRCNDRGVIETGNNDLPCECPAGDMQLFNTERGTETGAEIKRRR